MSQETDCIISKPADKKNKKETKNPKQIKTSAQEKSAKEKTGAKKRPDKLKQGLEFAHASVG